MCVFILSDRQKQLSSAAILRKARKISTDGKRINTGANPFHRASTKLQSTNQNPGLSTMTSSSGNTTSSSLAQGGRAGSGNPFFAQLAKKDKPAAPTPFGGNFTNPQPPVVPPAPQSQPPSYAAAVKGGPGSVPSFITHGPSSVPIAAQPEGIVYTSLCT